MLMPKEVALISAEMGFQLLTSFIFYVVLNIYDAITLKVTKCPMSPWELIAVIWESEIRVTFKERIHLNEFFY